MDIKLFLARCDAYCARSNMSAARLSTLVFGSGMTIGRLRDGGGVTVRVLERATAALSELEVGRPAPNLYQQKTEAA